MNRTIDSFVAVAMKWNELTFPCRMRGYNSNGMLQSTVSYNSKSQYDQYFKSEYASFLASKWRVEFINDRKEVIDYEPNT
jgi:hypothetical protein